jgi:hypothetical protein
VSGEAVDRFAGPASADVGWADAGAELARLLRELQRKGARRRGAKELTYRELARQTGWCRNGGESGRPALTTRWWFWPRRCCAWC